jgi:hypothetical protein
MDLTDELIRSLKKQIEFLERENNELRSRGAGTHASNASPSATAILNSVRNLQGVRDERIIQLIRQMCAERRVLFKQQRELAVGIADRAGRGILIDSLIETMTKGQADDTFEKQLLSLAEGIRLLVLEEVAREVESGCPA